MDEIKNYSKLSTKYLVIPHREKWIAYLVFVTTFCLLLAVLNTTRIYWQNEVKNELKHRAIVQSELIEQQLSSAFSSAYILGSLVQQHQGNLHDFPAIAESLMLSHYSIANVQLAPNGIVQQIYPLRGQEKAIGHNILLDDERKKEAFTAIEKHEMTVAGPFRLIQGGIAVIARQPVFLSDAPSYKSLSPSDGYEFWGFASVLVYLETIVNLTRLKDLEDAGYQYQLWRLHPDTGQVDIFSGKVTEPEAHRAREVIHLPNAIWYLDMAKPGITISGFTVSVMAFIALLFSLILSHWLYTLLHKKTELERLVANRTRQLTASKRDLEAKQHKLKILSNAVQQSGNVVIITDKNGIIEYVNPRFSEITGYSSEEAIGNKTSLLKSKLTSTADHRQFWHTILSGRSWYGERHNQQKNGTLYWSKMSVSPIKDLAGNITHFVSVSDDVTEDKAEHERILHMAYHDALTGVANRRYFFEQLEHCLKQVHRQQKSAAMMFIDLDKFKAVNDEYGHEAGDELLMTLADRFSTSVRETDIVARLGGDEFTILLTNITGYTEVEHLVKKLMIKTKEPVKLKGTDYQPSVSIGIVMIDPYLQLNSEEIISCADDALYQAKENGRNGYHFYHAPATC